MILGSKRLVVTSVRTTEGVLEEDQIIGQQDAQLYVDGKSMSTSWTRSPMGQLIGPLYRCCRCPFISKIISRNMRE